MGEILGIGRAGLADDTHTHEEKHMQLKDWKDGSDAEVWGDTLYGWGILQV